MIRIAARAKTVEDARAIMAHGFRILEVTLPCPGGPQEERAWEVLARETGLSYLAHGPEEGDPRNLVQLENIYLPRLKAALDAAERLKVSVLTIHLWLDSRVLAPEVILEKVKLLDQVVGWGRRRSVQVNLENLSETRSDLDAALLRIPDLKLTLDVGHAMLMQETCTAPEIIEKRFDRIGHLHLHDNQGGPGPRDDLHLVPGTGVVPFRQIFKLLKTRGYDKTATLELRPEEMTPARSWVEDVWTEA